MYKKHSLILLPTDEKSNIVLLNNTKKLLYNVDGMRNGISQTSNQHLYILNDERFKENEYISDGIEVIKATSKLVEAQTLHNRREWKKIIATTNNNISINLGKEKWVAPTNSKNDMVYTRLCPFPNLPFLFIQYYIEQYNLGNVITEVEVEYELSEMGAVVVELGAKKEDIISLKLNPDNTINIKPLKDSWTREEVKKLCMDALMHGYNGLPRDLTPVQGMNKWIENNL